MNLTTFYSMLRFWGSLLSVITHNIRSLCLSSQSIWWNFDHHWQFFKTEVSKRGKFYAVAFAVLATSLRWVSTVQGKHFCWVTCQQTDTIQKTTLYAAVILIAKLNRCRQQPLFGAHANDLSKYCMEKYFWGREKSGEKEEGRSEQQILFCLYRDKIPVYIEY